VTTPRTWLGAALLIVAASGGAASAQPRCVGYGSLVETGWREYRSANIRLADSLFAEAHARCPDRLDAQIGLGYTALRRGRLEDAASRFATVLQRSPGDLDALLGAGLAAWQRGDSAAAVRWFRAAREVQPDNATALDFLGRLAGLPPPDRAPLALPDTLETFARTRGDRFEVLANGGWRPVHVNGINLGAALPGRFPGEFPDSATYAAWIGDMAAMAANAIRVYTIHPPHFYQALAAHNAAHPERPLRLIHGVWAELPPKHDYRDVTWERTFFAEMRLVVDVVHGRADLPRRVGHAGGHYVADVSPWVLAYLIGREWEPFSVADFNRLRAADTTWPGRYVRVSGGSPMDAWLGRALDTLVAYETTTYRTQRPVGYTNWPTLDPMRHPTETTVREEVTMRERQGERLAEAPREYDNDSVGLDAGRMVPTPAFRGGVFAAFHAYPYYPDFMILDSAYGRASSSEGRSNYFGYLVDLKAHHPGMPILIAEYGLPASRATAHLQPQGWHHGGHAEAAAAEGNARLTREIAEAGMAGGALFAWIDEWFKKNWVVVDFERPGDRNRLWLNRLDPEQMYGVIAMEPLPAVPGATAAARSAAWRTLPPLLATRDGTLRAAADAGALWLRFDPVGSSAAGFELQIAFDIVDSTAGSHTLEGRGAPASRAGLELIVLARGDTVRVLKDPAVLPYRMRSVRRNFSSAGLRTPNFEDTPPGFFTGRWAQEYNRPLRPIARKRGDFRPERIVTNRLRFARDGTEFAAAGYDRGILIPGPPPDGDWERLPDGALEIRVPWLLLNVSDPSGRHVLLDPRGARKTDSVGTTVVETIGITLGVRRDGRWTTTPADGTARYAWEPWEEPRWRARPRPTFATMRDTWLELERVLGSGRE
jgi:hypothetical protein